MKYTPKKLFTYRCGYIDGKLVFIPIPVGPPELKQEKQSAYVGTYGFHKYLGNKL